MIAIRPAALVDDFEAKAASIMQSVKQSGPSIRLPGESSTRTTAARTTAGTLPIPAKIWEAITTTAKNGLP